MWMEQACLCLNICGSWGRFPTCPCCKISRWQVGNLPHEPQMQKLQTQAGMPVLQAQLHAESCAAEQFAQGLVGAGLVIFQREDALVDSVDQPGGLREK